MREPDASRSWVERLGHAIPDPVIIFIILLAISVLLSSALGGLEFTMPGREGEATTYTIRNMLDLESVRWALENAVLANWLGFGSGIVGLMVVVIFGVGIAERSGLLSALIRSVALRIPARGLPLFLVFTGVMSSVAGDVGYLVLIPLAGLLYAGLGQNPVIGMAAAFAGVSAGFSANLVPATPIDVIMGLNAQQFAEAQGVPFSDRQGNPLNPATMNYYFMVASTFVLTLIGAIVTRRFIQPKLAARSYVVPETLATKPMSLDTSERRGLKGAVIGLGIALALIAMLLLGPLAPYTTETGEVANPLLNSLVILVAFVFATVGISFGVAANMFRRPQDVVDAAVAQMNTMGYILVLTFVAYNFLSIFDYSGLGAYVTYMGVTLLEQLALGHFPLLLLIGFTLVVAAVNLLIGGMISKWLLLGPIVVPMMYYANPAMTPDVVTAAYRIADSATNVVTPMLIYYGIILAFMREYMPELGLGDLILIMLPYAVAFLCSWILLFSIFFLFGIPLGF